MAKEYLRISLKTSRCLKLQVHTTPQILINYQIEVSSTPVSYIASIQSKTSNGGIGSNPGVR